MSSTQLWEEGWLPLLATASRTHAASPGRLQTNTTLSRLRSDVCPALAAEGLPRSICCVSLHCPAPFAVCPFTQLIRVLASIRRQVRLEKSNVIGLLTVPLALTRSLAKAAGGRVCSPSLLEGSSPHCWGSRARIASEVRSFSALTSVCSWHELESQTVVLLGPRLWVFRQYSECS